MNQTRLDALARALAGGMTRRSALAVLAGIAAVALPGEDISAKKRKRRCRKDSPPGQCCRKKGGEITCACKEGRESCSDACVDLRRDPDHCGACGNPCPINESCVDGACVCGDFGEIGPATCCAGAESYMIAAAASYQCTPETERTDCYLGWTCCAGRCMLDGGSCAVCAADSDCAGGELCCDGRCKKPFQSACPRFWVYTNPDTCEFVVGEPCPEGYTACEGKNADDPDTVVDTPGWVCCPAGSTCAKDLGVCLRG